MAHLTYYSRMASQKIFAPGTSDELKKLEWDPNELLELKVMSRRDLLGLMMFCDIRVYEDTPVISCTEDEMRMAYLSWRCFYSAAERIKYKRKFRIYKKVMKETSKHLINIGTKGSLL